MKAKKKMSGIFEESMWMLERLGLPRQIAMSWIIFLITVKMQKADVILFTIRGFAEGLELLRGREGLQTGDVQNVGG